MKKADTCYSTVSICMPMVLLASAFIAQFLHGVSHDIALPAGYLLMVMATAAGAGMICGIAGFVKKEKMKWLSVAGTLENACLGLICYAVLGAL